MISALNTIPNQKLQLLFLEFNLCDIISSPVLTSNKASSQLPSNVFITPACLIAEFFISFEKSKICFEILKKHNNTYLLDDILKLLFSIF